MQFRRTALVAALSVVALTAAACGDDAEDRAAEPTVAEAPEFEAGTTMAEDSSVSRATGRTSLIVTGLLLVSVAPTITAPATISASGRPRRWATKRGRPTAPPAPPTFSN